MIILALALALSASGGIHTHVDAQNDGLSVTVVRVESGAFPQVEVYVSVLDQNGLPVYGLTETHWTIVEKGLPESPPIVVQPDITQGLDLVLAIDVSVEASALPQIQETVRKFIHALNPTDRLAVVTFADEVQVVQDLTTPEEALKATGTLTITGLSTTLNEAAVQSVALLETSSAPRKAVIILTDSPDNAGKLAFDPALSQVQAADVPIHILGYGPKMARTGVDQLKRLAQVTGGQAFILLAFQDVQSPLQALALLLHQGYRITFQSNHLADGVKHDFSVQVAYEGLEGRSDGQLGAQTGPVQVDLLELAAGQTVGGVVDLTASAIAPALIESVTYWLEDALIGEAVKPPYRVQWDSIGDAPGTYTLTVQARDAAGNEGWASIELNVAHPVVITALTAPDRVQPGASLTVQAKIDAVVELARVEFLLDGRSLGTGTAVGAGVYELAVDSRPYAPGDHLMAVRAQDRLGRSAEAGLNVHFIAPLTPTPVPTLTPTPTPAPLPSEPAWLKPTVGILSIVVILVAVLFLLAGLFHWQRLRRQGTFKLEIANLGNVPSRYELRAEVLENALKTRFLLNGADLPRREVVEHTEVIEPVESGEPRQAERPGASSGLPGVADSRTRKVRQNPLEKIRGVVRLGDMLADLLITVAYLLPGSLRSSLLSFSSTFRRGRMTMNRVDYASSRVSDSATRAAGASTARRSQGQPRGASPSGGVQVPTVTRVDATRAWSQTPVAEAGENLLIQLLVVPTRLYRAGMYTFKVISKSIEQESAPVQTQEGYIQVPRVSWFFHILSVLVVAGAITAVAFIGFWLKL
ncbi:MAG: VWA domain-containing protein [Anaerolineae bacterium]|nr:VWA domain-containing protein [Anaerolineae bacterium]